MKEGMLSGAFLLSITKMMKLPHSILLCLAICVVFPLCGNAQKQSKPTKLRYQNIGYVPSGFPVGFALTTCGNRQYVAFYDSTHAITVACRSLNSQKWDFQKLDSKVAWDSHNYLSLAIDKLGYIHLSGNMHSGPLIYFKSSEPFNIHSLKKLNSMLGKEEDVTTYPEFMTDPKGELIFHYRYGRSGSGYEVYNILNTNTQQWNRLLNKPLTDGRSLRNAYMQGPVLGKDGYYHLIWVWRDSPDCSTNHSLSYARSKDLLHWESVRGEKVELPITIDYPQLVVDSAPVKGGLINIGIKIGFDSQNRLLIGYHKYDEKVNTQLFITRFEQGKWISKQLSHWNYRWDFKGMGTIVNEILIESPRASAKAGELVFGFHHNAKYGNGQVIINEKTLEPIAIEEFEAGYPKELDNVQSTFPGMLVNTAFDKGKSPDGTQYLLRWETLSPNRDEKREGVLPPASRLQLYELKKIK